MLKALLNKTFWQVNWKFEKKKVVICVCVYILNCLAKSDHLLILIVCNLYLYPKCFYYFVDMYCFLLVKDF